MTDSIAGPDTIFELPELQLDTTLIKQWEEADSVRTDTIATVQPPPPPDWHDGIEGQNRSQSGRNDSGLLTILTLLFVALALNFRHCPKIFANFAGQIFSMRKRGNMFDEHTTNETRVMVIMLLQYVAYLGILLYAWAGLCTGGSAEDGNVFRDTVRLMGLVVGYYVFQVVAYSLTGWMFGTPEERRQWLRSFNSSQALAGLVLMIPALVCLFYPDVAYEGLIAGAAVYLVARLLFIIKGFRIFFKKYSSLMYFILYLCTLEIIPFFAVLYSALLITG